MFWIAAAVHVAAAADVWATIEATDDRGTVRLQVPAQALVELGQWPIRTAYAGPVDLSGLAREVADGGPGTSRKVHVTGERGQVATLVLTSLEAAGPAPQELGVTIAGPGDQRLEMSMPLDRGTLRRAIRGVDTGIDLAKLGIELSDKETIEIVKRHPPTVLIDVRASPGETSVTIETR